MSELSMLADEQMRAESDALYHAGMGDELSLSDREKCDEVVRLRHENAKLRELVQYILDESYGDDWFVMKAGELGLEANY